MTLVDSSVWIAHLRGERTEATAKLEAAAGREPLLVGDLILVEVLQGARDEAHAARIERGLRRYDVVSLLDAELAVQVARNYRTLRGLGITMRKTADIVIGTSASCIGMCCCMTIGISCRWSGISGFWWLEADSYGGDGEG